MPWLVSWEAQTDLSLQGSLLCGDVPGAEGGEMYVGLGEGFIAICENTILVKQVLVLE